jgi:hypothetical protein
MDLTDALRDKRRELVIAAEAVIDEAFNKGECRKLKRTQLNHLVAICGDAACAEEIANYIRYQVGRGTIGWERSFSDRVREGIKKTLEGIQDDPSRVQAWRLYAVYLTRAFTYHNEKARGR